MLAGPPAALEPMYTPGRVSSEAAQKSTDGQEIARRELGATPVKAHFQNSAVGFVDVATSPFSSTAAQKPVEGQAMLEIRLGPSI